MSARARHPLYRAHAGRELPRPARQSRQPSRQHATGDAALRPRRDGGRARAWICAGHRSTACGRAARERRAHARDDGDIQRVVRPHSDTAPGWRRPDRCDEAAPVGRLDTYVARSRRARARLHEVGRSPGFGARRARGDPARVSHRDDVAAGTHLRGARRRAAGGSPRGTGPAARPRAFRAAAAGVPRRKRCARSRELSKVLRVRSS